MVGINGYVFETKIIAEELGLATGRVLAVHEFPKDLGYVGDMSGSDSPDNIYLNKVKTTDGQTALSLVYYVRPNSNYFRMREVLILENGKSYGYDFTNLSDYTEVRYAERSLELYHDEWIEDVSPGAVSSALTFIAD